MGAGAPLRDNEGNVITKATPFQKQIAAPPVTIHPNPATTVLDPSLLMQLANSGLFSTAAASAPGNPLEALLKQFLAQQSVSSSYAASPVAVASTDPMAIAAASADMTFARGQVDVDKLPPWQRDEMLRKQKQLNDHQDSLKRQMDEKKRLKDLELQKEQEREDRENQKLEKERRELEERYRRDPADSVIPTLAGKKQAAFGEEEQYGSHSAAQTNPTLRNATGDHAKSNGAGDAQDAVQRYLQAQAEAEALKKSKFKSKRVQGAEASDNSNNTPPPQRIYSPPLPTMRKKQESSMDDEMPTQQPMARASSPPLPAQRKTQRDAEEPFTDFAPLDMVSPPPPPPLVERKPSRTDPTPPVFPDRKRSTDSQVDGKTKSVLEQLSMIKQELERERHQIQKELDRRKSSSPVLRRPERSVRDSPAVERHESPSASHAALSNSDSAPTGSPILDRILANIQASNEALSQRDAPSNQRDAPTSNQRMSARSQRGSMSRNDSDIDGILSKQDKKLQKQEMELDGLRQDVDKHAKLK